MVTGVEEVTEKKSELVRYRALEAGGLVPGAPAAPPPSQSAR